MFWTHLTGFWVFMVFVLGSTDLLVFLNQAESPDKFFMSFLSFSLISCYNFLASAMTLLSKLSFNAWAIVVGFLIVNLISFSNPFL